MKLVMATMILFTGTVYADVGNKINSFLEVSGFNMEAAGYQAAFSRGVKIAYSQKKSIEPKVRNSVKRLIPEYFNPSIIKKDVKKMLLKNVNEFDLDIVLKLYEKPVIKKMRVMASAIDTPEFIDRLKSFDTESLSIKKRSEIDRLYEVMHFRERLMELEEVALQGNFHVVNANLSIRERKSAKDISGIFKNSMTDNFSDYETDMKKKLYLAFSKARIWEIRAYRRFLSSEPVRKLYENLFEARRKVLRKAASGFGDELSREVEMMDSIRVKEGVRG